MTDQGDASPASSWRELTALLLLSATAILTAWCGFQSSKWSGAMSIAFSQASGARIEASRLEGVANRKMTIHVGLFTQWLDAKQEGADDLADFLALRFPDPLEPAFQAWVATEPLKDPNAPETPFAMPEYALPDLAASEEADERADGLFDEALKNNQRGDNYTILTVLYATVLFFAAISGRARTERAKWALLGVGLTGFTIATLVLISYPRLI